MNRPLNRANPLHALLLAACLLVAQWGGSVHRVEHGAPSGVHPVTVAKAAIGEHAHQGHAGHEPGTAECLLIDHALAQADAWLPALLLGLDAQRHVAPQPPAAVAWHGAAAVVYLARGPPDIGA